MLCQCCTNLGRAHVRLANQGRGGVEQCTVRNGCGITLCQRCTNIVVPVYGYRPRGGDGAVYG